MAVLNQRGTDAFAVVATIDPDAYAVSTQNSDGVDMSKFESVSFIVLLGELGTSATIDFTVKSGADNTTFGNTVKAVTQLTQAGTDSDKQVVVNVRAEDLTEGDRYVRGEMAIGTATSDCGMVAIGFNARHAPASNHDLSTVDEILNS